MVTRDCKKLAFFRARSFELFSLRTAVRAEPTSPITVIIIGFKMIYIWAKSINIWLRCDLNSKSSFYHAPLEYGCPNCELSCGLSGLSSSYVSVEYNFCRISCYRNVFHYFKVNLSIHIHEVHDKMMIFVISLPNVDGFCSNMGHILGNMGSQGSRVEGPRAQALSGLGRTEPRLGSYNP